MSGKNSDMVTCKFCGESYKSGTGISVHMRSKHDYPPRGPKVISRIEPVNLTGSLVEPDASDIMEKSAWNAIQNKLVPISRAQNVEVKNNAEEVSVIKNETQNGGHELTIRVPDAMVDALKECCFDKEKTKSLVVADALAAYLKAEGYLA